jgi:hypothetical protein
MRTRVGDFGTLENRFAGISVGREETPFLKDAAAVVARDRPVILDSYRRAVFEPALPLGAHRGRERGAGKWRNEDVDDKRLRAAAGRMRRLIRSLREQTRNG